MADRRRGGRGPVEHRAPKACSWRGWLAVTARTYQAPRIAITDATIGRPDLDPDRASFTIALHTARDQLIAAAGVIAETVTDLVGVIGRHVLDNRMPDRRLRINPRVVKRAISKLVASSAKGRVRAPSRPATITIKITARVDP